MPLTRLLSMRYDQLKSLSYPLIELFIDVFLFFRVEVEQNLLNRKFKTLTAYYGDLVEEEQEYWNLFPERTGRLIPV